MSVISVGSVFPFQGTKSIVTRISTIEAAGLFHHENVVEQMRATCGYKPTILNQEIDGSLKRGDKYVEKYQRIDLKCHPDVPEWEQYGWRWFFVYYILKKEEG